MPVPGQSRGKAQVNVNTSLARKPTLPRTVEEIQDRNLRQHWKYRKLGSFKRKNPDMPPKERELVATPAARPRGHTWSQFEIDTLLSLMARNIHVYGLQVTKEQEQDTAARGSTHGSKAKNRAGEPHPISKKAAHMDVATALNRTLHGEKIAEDIDHRDVSAMIDRLMTQKKGTLAVVERMNRPRMTRMTRQILQRNIGFTGTKEEWEAGRKREVEEVDRKRAEKRYDTAMGGVGDGKSGWDEGTGDSATATSGNPQAFNPWGEPSIRQSVEREDIDPWGEDIAAATLKTTQTTNKTVWGGGTATPNEYPFHSYPLGSGPSTTNKATALPVLNPYHGDPVGSTFSSDDANTGSVEWGGISNTSTFNSAEPTNMSDDWGTSTNTTTFFNTPPPKAGNAAAANQWGGGSSNGSDKFTRPPTKPDNTPGSRTASLSSPIPASSSGKLFISPDSDSYPARHDTALTPTSPIIAHAAHHMPRNEWTPGGSNATPLPFNRLAAPLRSHGGAAPSTGARSEADAPTRDGDEAPAEGMELEEGEIVEE